VPLALGLNPSFATYYSRQILFADPMRRAKRFVVFDAAGNPTEEGSTLDDAGWPVLDGRWHGAILYADMAGTAPAVVDSLGHARIRGNENYVAVSWKTQRPALQHLEPNTPAGFYRPGLQMMLQAKPTALRTLDWSWTNARTDWSRPRVLPGDPIQGSARGMAIEHQVAAANAVNAALWWCAPPRYELPFELWEMRLVELLTVIRDEAKVTPILEYGNELWNSAFPVHRWLQEQTSVGLPRWTDIAAREIESFWRVVESVFGPKPYFTFVGGHLQDAGVLDRILTKLPAAPTLAGPAAYVGALKEDVADWERAGSVPSQDALERSTFLRLGEVERRLELHHEVVRRHGVRYLAVYEAGQAFLAKGRPWKQAALQAQRETWLGALYLALRGVLERQGVSLACWYSLATSQEPADSRVDVFGLMGGQGMALLPKARAAFDR
jgi:hypothetical protein